MDRKVVVLLALLALGSNTLGYWEYEGTWAYVDPNGGDVDPEGKWGYWWHAGGSIEADLWELSISGDASGGTWVFFWADESPSEWVSVYSTAYAESSYRWKPDQGMRTISAQIEISISNGDINYRGWAEGWFDNACVATCGAGAHAEGFGRVYQQYLQPCGYGQGKGQSGSWAWATNNGWDAIPYENWAVSYYYPGNPLVYPPYACFEGRRRFTAQCRRTFRTTPPWRVFQRHGSDQRYMYCLWYVSNQ